MSWFSKHFGIKLDSHSLGNFLKDISPAAGLVGGPLGVALAGGLSTAGDLGRGKNIGQALKGSIGNATLGAGIGSLASHGFLGGGLQSFAGGAPGTAGTAAGSVAGDAGTSGAAGTAGSAATDAATAGAAAAPAPVTSALSLAPEGGFPAISSAGVNAATLPASSVTSAPGILSRVGGFIEHHPTASSLGLQGIGKLATVGSDNAAARAQARLYGTQADAADYALQREKGQDAALDPFRASLLGTLGKRLTQPVSANPYLPPPSGG